MPITNTCQLKYLLERDLYREEEWEHVWWSMAIVPGVWRRRQEDDEFRRTSSSVI